MGDLWFLDVKGGRRWTEIVPTFRELGWNSGESVFVGQPARGDVVIFHEEGGTVGQKAQELASSGVWIVAVSQGGGAGQLESGGYYQRRQGVDKPVDAQFRACLTGFLEDLKTEGKPDWTLLEGPPAPDALLGLHLLSLLPSSEDQVARPELRKRAAREAVSILAARGKSCEELNLDDHAARRRILEDC